MSHGRAAILLRFDHHPSPHDKDEEIFIGRGSSTAPHVFATRAYLSYSPRVKLHFAKDAHKFSAAHMTLFPDGTKERLHGHNYQVEVTVEVASAEGDAFIAFSELKQTIREVCDQLDERVLLPSRSPRLTVVQQDADEIEIVACDRRYVFPADEVVLLDMDNVVTETLATHVARQLAMRWKPLFDQKRMKSVEVTIRETLGQGASVRLAPAGAKGLE